MANPSLWNLVTHDVGIDLGTANTMVAVKGHGIVISEPSVVAVNKNTKQIMAVGAEARRMIGRTPANIVAVRPLRDGVISDFDSTEAMIRYFVRKVHKDFPKLFTFAKPRVVIGVPSNITEVEGKAVIDAAVTAGARKAYIIEEPMAAAIGASIPIEDAAGSMVIDIGGGTTDIAIISLGGIVVDNTIRIAGDEIDQEIVNYARHKYNVAIGEKQAEDIKIAIGSAYPMRKEKEAQLKGRDLISGLPKSMTVTSVEVREAITKVLDKIAEAAREALEQTPPEILSDLLERGITLVGGGALLDGIDKYFEEKLQTPVIIDEDPMSAVARGTSILLSEIDLLERIQVKGEEFI
ncbi:MreB/Mrl family cell shape determining protein [Candidatus Dojkabacteria bacterium]|nr:MreB/Mrl family cell shape determining protein [Candidatus Dojkabacteria bacterium]